MPPAAVVDASVARTASGGVAVQVGAYSSRERAQEGWNTLSARHDALKGVKPVSLIARARKKHNLDTSDDYQRLADIRRVLMASCAPAFLQSEGHPRYLEAALGVLEKTLPRVA